MKPHVKVPLKYGVMAAVIGTGLVILLYYLNQHPFMITPVMDFRVILFGIFIFFSLKEVRDYHQNGILYFWQGLIGSFIFVATFAVLASGMIAVFISVVPEFLQSYISQAIERVKSMPPEVINQIGKKAYDSNLKTLPSTNVFDLVEIYLMQSFIIGLFISIILSVILRRQPKN
jgi:hypothetical protein